MCYSALINIFVNNKQFSVKVSTYVSYAELDKICFIFLFEKLILMKNDINTDAF